VPQGVLENLVTLLAERLQAGVPAERLEFVVARASIERVCKSQIESRRLEIRTPVGTDVDNRTSLAGERITVSGEGQPARDEAGVAQAWFDPAKPVVLRFLTIDGDVERVENQLPLTHALVFDDKEYRFLAAPADRRGFVDLAVQECDYP